MAAALVVEPGQVIAQRVLEDLVRAQRQVGRIAGQVIGRQVLLDGGDVPGQPGRDGVQREGALSVPESVLEPVQPGEGLVVHAVRQAVGQPVYRDARAPKLS